MTNPDELERAVAAAEEWIAMAETCEIVWPFGVLRYPPICNSEFEDLRLILAANRKMRTALEPFVQTANQCPANWPDEARPGVINLGHCREARSALSTKEQLDV